MTFFGWFVHYALVFAILAVVSGLGVFVGKKLSDKKNAQNEAADVHDAK